MITDQTARAEHVNALLGRPYQAGGNGPESFDCYGLARHLQAAFFGRDLPVFTMPAEAGRFAIASAITVHPERARWREIAAPIDGAIAVMARQENGFHMGVFLDLDGGTIVHALEEQGVVAERPFLLTSPAARWQIGYFEEVASRGGPAAIERGDAA